MRRRLWNTCLVSPTFCKVFLLCFSSTYSARALIGIKHLISVQFQPLALFSHKSITLAPSQEAIKKKNPNKSKSKQAEGLCATRNCWEQTGPSRGPWEATWHLLGLQSRTFSWGKQDLLVEWSPSCLAPWCCSIPRAQGSCSSRAGSGEAQEQEQSCSQVGTGTVLQLTRSQRHHGWARSAHLAMCLQFQGTGASGIRTTII